MEGNGNGTKVEMKIIVINGGPLRDMLRHNFLMLPMLMGVFLGTPSYTESER